MCDEVSNTFTTLSEYPSVVKDSDLQALDKFVVLKYSQLWTRPGLISLPESKDDLIPPTQSALKEHAKRASGEPSTTSTCYGELLGVDQMCVYQGMYWKV